MAEMQPQRDNWVNWALVQANRLPPVDNALRGRAKWMIEELSLTEEMAPEELEVTDKGVVEKGVNREVTHGQRVLFIGAGKGHEMEAVLNEFPGVKAVGLDPHDNIAPPVEQRLKEAGHHFEYAHKSVHASELKGVSDNSVDAVTLLFVLHHVEPSEYDEVVKEIMRVLKPGGKVFVAEDLVDGEAERAVTEREDRKANLELSKHSPHHYKNIEGWREFFAARGLEMKRSREVKPKAVRHGFFTLVKKPE